MALRDGRTGRWAADRLGEGRADTWALFLQRAAHSAALAAAYKAPPSRSPTPPHGRMRSTCVGPARGPAPSSRPGRGLSRPPRAGRPVGGALGTPHHAPRPRSPGVQVEHATHLVTLITSLIS